MKMFCEPLGELAMNIINLEKKKLTPLTNKQKSYEKTKIGNICKKMFEQKYSNDKNEALHIVYVIYSIACQKKYL